MKVILQKSHIKQLIKHAANPKANHRVLTYICIKDDVAYATDGHVAYQCPVGHNSKPNETDPDLQYLILATDLKPYLKGKNIWAEVDIPGGVDPTLMYPNVERIIHPTSDNSYNQCPKGLKDILTESIKTGFTLVFFRFEVDGITLTYGLEGEFTVGVFYKLSDQDLLSEIRSMLSEDLNYTVGFQTQFLTELYQFDQFSFRSKCNNLFLTNSQTGEKSVISRFEPGDELLKKKLKIALDSAVASV